MKPVTGKTDGPREQGGFHASFQEGGGGGGGVLLLVSGKAPVGKEA